LEARPARGRRPRTKVSLSEGGATDPVTRGRPIMNVARRIFIWVMLVIVFGPFPARSQEPPPAHQPAPPPPETAPPAEQHAPPRPQAPPPAQQPAPSAQETAPPVQQNAPPRFKPEELDQLVAPIALHPDPLLAQILMASTYPLEIVQAARFVKEQPNIKG